MARSAVLAPLVACLLLLVHTASAASLGCFRLSKATATKRSSQAACQAQCRSKRMPIYIYDWTGGCGCNAVIPSKRGRISSGLCSRKAPNSAAVGYVHAVNGKACFLNPKPLQPVHWSADANPQLSVFQGTNSVVMNVQGTTSSTLTARNIKQTYGFFTVGIKIAGPMSGPVTAAYWTTDYSGQNRADFDEIDLEFINWNNGAASPGCLWAHHYLHGQSKPETKICPAEIKSLAGLPSQPEPWSKVHVYGLDWQPTYMRWYVDGRLVHSRDYDASQVPSRAMFLKITTWAWSDGQNCNNFGGCTFDNSAAFQALFADVKLITCKP